MVPVEPGEHVNDAVSDHAGATAEQPGVVRAYYVDEAGDPVLWGRRGQPLVGTEGCSRYFILGLLDVRDEALVNAELAAVRDSVMSDPYLESIPSMKPERRKTALAFHAKDDCPEVRWRVFTALRQLGDALRFYAVVCGKREHADLLAGGRVAYAHARYTDSDLYDALVRRLFRDRLHKADAYTVRFAKRGKSDRTEALRVALTRAKQRFTQRWGRCSDAPITIEIATPAEHASLQAVDYFLWALQRLYERGEDRHVRYLWGSFRLVHDIYDTRNHDYGEYYDSRSPLSLDALKERL